MSDSDDDGAVQGAVVGVIVPPPDKRVICDKTAQFVARNGPSFLKKIRASDPTGRKFSFLNGDDIYNAYFLKKVKDFQAALAAKEDAEATQKQVEQDAGQGQTEASEQQPPQSDTGDQEAQPGDAEQTPAQEEDGTQEEAAVVKEAVMNIVAAASRKIPDGPPPRELFALTHPPAQESAMQLDIIKHTAQFTAACGSDFLKGLAAREHRNPQFDFLKHTHAYFGYFTALVESYAKILKKDKTVFARLKADALSRDHILRRCVHRMNFQRKEEERRKAEEEEEDADRVAFQSIDWHDFVVVETIDFPDTEELPVAEESGPPEPTAAITEEDDEMDMDMDMDMDESDAEATDVKADVLAAAGVKLRTDYVPKVEGQTQKAVTHFVDPKTGTAVPIEEVSDHMRIELMDPKYMEQQARRMEKARETALAHDETISDNLKRFASRRTDIFGGSEVKDDENQPAIIWDGVNADPEVKQVLTMQAARAQIAREKRERENAKPKPNIGPSVPTRAGAGAGAGSGASASAASASGPTPTTTAPSATAPAPSGTAPPPMPLGLPGAGPPGGLGPGALGMRALMGGGLGMGAPPVPPAGPPPASLAPLPRPEVSEDLQPPQKRSRVTKAGLQSEEDWVAAHPGAQPLIVSVPAEPDSGSWKLEGQTITVSVEFGKTVRELKQQLQGQLGDMPPNKMLLKSTDRGFLKDSFTLAHYNLRPGETLKLSAKRRGKKR